MVPKWDNAFPRYRTFAPSNEKTQHKDTRLSGTDPAQGRHKQVLAVFNRGQKQKKTLT
jgi:hypothetical protein